MNWNAAHIDFGQQILILLLLLPPLFVLAGLAVMTPRFAHGRGRRRPH